MDKFVAYRLRFLGQATTDMSLPMHKGSMLRGAFLAALRRDFCMNKPLSSCLGCPAHAVCPICSLAATVDEAGPRGAEVPRPFSLQPILDPLSNYQEGDTFEFGITLFGDSLTLFPYVILAVKAMGELGMGRRWIGAGNREKAAGQFCLAKASVVNPLTGSTRQLYTQAEAVVRVPESPITHHQVLDYASRLPTERVTLQLLTPLRLVSEGALVKRLSFRILLQRLLRRLTDISRYCCHEELQLDFAGLLEMAEQVAVVDDRTTWLDLSSFSSRRGRSTPIGGLVGEITFSGELQPFLPFILWGQFVHVGKDTTKGDGWIQIAES